MLKFAELLDTAEMADLGPGPRAGVLPQPELDKELQGLFKAIKVSSVNQQLVQALVLLWHDYLDAAHTLAQSIENADGAYVHAIMHRREPDYGNAAYWFRRVGRHAAFPELARRASELISQLSNKKLSSSLILKGEWNPFAFVDACEQAAGGGVSKDDQKLLRQVQRIEFEVLLSSIVGGDVRRL